MDILWGFIGIIVILLIAFLFSNNKKHIRYRTVIPGLIIQILLAVLLLKWPTGRNSLGWFSARVQDLINYANEGIGFLFGGLIKGHGMIFVLNVLPVIIFLGALIGIFYYFGIIQWIIQIFGGGISKILGTSKLESLYSISTMVLGQSEAPLLI